MVMMTAITPSEKASRRVVLDVGADLCGLISNLSRRINDGGERERDGGGKRLELRYE